ncbi:GNAT family N-acetyltransferase [Chakrabartyella piscis]|uniref:GNAT family N-acetyltransferase n=1 Tax=Chakrabartyella piscis TaxID=2918914 RepID=UPI00295842C2|nr:GNAT family N-acetyltransferase [Chakrabartyella piscis]
MFQKLNKEQFELVYPILEDSFPVEELRTKENQRSLLDKPEYTLCAIKGENGVVQGVAAYWELDDFLYIDHLAIKKEARNGGIGGKRFMELIAQIGKPVVLEVELPEGELEQRRIAFYERLGFFYNDYPYLQPPMREGDEMFPLRYMTYPDKIDEITYERYKRNIYKVAYGYEE